MKCFEICIVPEPSEEEALEMLRARRDRWEALHPVRVDDSALVAAVALTQRHDAEHRLPRKAMDLVDRVAARARVAQHDGQALTLPRVAGTVRVDAHSVALAIAKAHSLAPETAIAHAEGGLGEGGAALEAFLAGRLVGQEHVVQRLPDRFGPSAAREGRAGPIATFLFLGPTGAGKTETARLLAEHLYGSPDDLVRFDLSAFAEESSAARFLGAAAAEAAEEEGQLLAALRARPWAVVLLDEIDRAHLPLLEQLRRLLEAGSLVDACGRRADLRHAVFVLTAPLTIDAAARQLPAGLVARVDETLVFRPLSTEELRVLLRRRIARLADAFRAKQGVQVAVEAEAEAFVLQTGAVEGGAGGLDRAIERLVETPLSALHAARKLAKASSWRLAYDEGGVYWVPAE